MPDDPDPAAPAAAPCPCLQCSMLETIERVAAGRVIPSGVIFQALVGIAEIVITGAPDAMQAPMRAELVGVIAAGPQGKPTPAPAPDGAPAMHWGRQ